MKTALEEIMQLSISERILVVEKIWDSIESRQYNIPITNDEIAILNNRLEDYNLNPNDGSDWETVKKKT